LLELMDLSSRCRHDFTLLPGTNFRRFGFNRTSPGFHNNRSWLCETLVASSIL